MNKVVGIIVGIIVLIIIIYGGYRVVKHLSHSSTPAPVVQTQQTSKSVTSAPTQAQSTSSAKATNQQFTIVGTNFKFTPSTLTVKKDEPVTITFKNNGQAPHNLTITDLNVATKTIEPGQQDTITFTPDKAGQFGFLCTVPGHADKGMRGTLVVQ